MADRTITATAVISAKDDTGAAFGSIAKKLEAMNQKMASLGKNSAAVDKANALAAAFKRTNDALKTIDKFSGAQAGFSQMREKFRTTQEAVQRMAQAMKAMEKPSAGMQAAYSKAQEAASKAATAFERQKTATMDAAAALKAYGIPAGRIAAEQARMKASIDTTTAALQKQTAAAEKAAARKAGRHEAVRSGLGTLGMMAGPGILHGTYKAAKSGAEIQSEIVKLRAAGIPEEDIARAVDATGKLQSRYTNVKRSDMLERFKELRSVLLHPEEAHQLLETTIKASSALNAADRTGHSSEGLGFAIKGAEVLGLAQDPKRFEAYLDSFVKSMQVMGKTVTPEGLYENAKYYKASGSSLSDRFKFTTGYSLAQELGGSTAGVSIDQLIKQVIGGFQGAQHAAAKSFLDLGLLDKGDVEQTKTGSIKGLKPGHHVKGHKLAQTDPDKWIYDYYLPALVKAGITEQDDQLAHVRRDFPAGRAADAVAKIITQRSSFENHAKLFPLAAGLNGGEASQGDPFVAMNSLTTSLSNLAGTITSPAMQAAAPVISSLATSIGGMAEAAAAFEKAHPEASKAIGGGALAVGGAVGVGATWGLISNLISGFGLKGSAAALDGSALALTRAAAALGAPSVLKSVGPAAAAATTPWWGPAGVAIGGAARFVLPFAAPAVAAAGAFAFPFIARNAVDDAGYDGLTLGERLRRQRGGSMRDAYRNSFDDDRLRLGLPTYGGMNAPAMPTDFGNLPSWRGAGGGISQGGGSISDLIAAIRGNADKPVQVETTIKTEGMITVRALPGTEVVNTTSRGDIKLGTGTTTVGSGAAGPSAN